MLVNPAVTPHKHFDGYLGTQRNHYTDETWELTLTTQALAELEVPAPVDASRYQVWLQTADETLDYRHAERYYRACALRIQAGGDHSFQGFAERLPACWRLPVLRVGSLQRSIFLYFDFLHSPD